MKFFEKKATFLRIAIIIFFLIFHVSASNAAVFNPDDYIKGRKNTIQNILNQMSIEKDLQFDELLSALYFYKTFQEPYKLKLSEEKKECVNLFFHVIQGNYELSRHMFQKLKTEKQLKKCFRQDVIQSMENQLFYKKKQILFNEKQGCSFQCLAIADYYFSNDEIPKGINVLKEITHSIKKSQNFYNSKNDRMVIAYIISLMNHFENYQYKKTSKIDKNDLKTLKKEFSLWQRLIPPPPKDNVSSSFAKKSSSLKDIEKEKYFGGTFTINSDKSSMDIYFEKENENLAARFHLNQNWIMLYEDHSFYWKAKERIYRTPKIFKKLESYPSAYFLEFNFSNNQFQYHSSIIHNQDKFIFRLPEWIINPEKRPVSVYYNKKRNSYIIFPVGIRIILTSFFSELQFKNNKMQQFHLSQGSSGFHLKLHDIFYEKKDHVKKDFYVKEYTEVSHAIPVSYLNRILVSIINKEQSKSYKNKKTSKIDTLVNNFYLQKNKIYKLPNEKIAKKGDYFYSLAKQEENDPRLWYIAAGLYFESFRFAKSEYCAYKYITLDKKNQFAGLNFSTSEDPEQTILHIYIYSLVQNNKVSQALSYMKLLELSEKDKKNAKAESLQYYMLVAQLHIQNGNYNKALQAYDKLIALSKNHSDYLNNAHFHKMIILMYLKQFDHAKKYYKDISLKTIKEDFASTFNESHDKKGKMASVRFKNMKPVMGKGKNFCAPIAIQFAMQALAEKTPSQKEIAKELKTSEHGTGFSEIIAYFKKRNINVTPYVANLEDIAAHLQKGWPVLTLMYQPEMNIGHITPVIGVDLDTRMVYFSEPDQTTSITVMPEKKFMDYQIHTGNISLFITPIDNSSGLNEKTNPGHFVAEYMDYLSANASIKIIDDLLTKIESINHPRTRSFTYYQRTTLIYRKILKKIPYTSKDQLFLKTIRPTLTNYNSYYETQIIQGKLYHLYNQTYNAKLSWENALKLNPKSWEASLLLSDLYLKYQNYEKSREIINKAIKDNPPDIFYRMYLYNLVVIYANLNDYEKAIPIGLEIVDFNKRNKFTENFIKLLKKSGKENTLNFLRDIIFGNF